MMKIISRFFELIELCLYIKKNLTWAGRFKLNELCSPVFKARKEF